MVEITGCVANMQGVTESGPDREHLVELLQDYADEAGRLGHAFAAGQGLHRTDAQALLAVLRAERAGAALTPGRLGEEVGLSSGATTPTDRPNAPDPPSPPATICSSATSSRAPARTRSPTVALVVGAATVAVMSYPSIVEPLDRRDYRDRG